MATPQRVKSPDRKQPARRSTRKPKGRKPSPREHRFRAACLRLGAICALLLILAALGAYLERGNRLSDLPRHAVHLPERILDSYSGLLDVLRGLGRAAIGRTAPEAPRSPATVPSETLAVYFAPGLPGDPDGIEAAFLAFLDRAQVSLYAAFYDLDLPEAADALTRKHAHGVDVRIVTDSDYRHREPLQACLRAGIPVVFDTRSPFMHNKFCVVDGEYVWTGSTNITPNGMRRNNNNAVRIHAPELAANYIAEFGEMLDHGRFGNSSPRNTPHPELRVAGVRIENYFAPEDNAAREIVEEIENASRSIRFMAFVFTSADIADAMARRIPHNVTVEGIVEARSSASDGSRDEYLRAAGATVHLDTNRYTMHHKVIIIDTRTVITGSYNFTRAAEEKNDENILVIHDPLVAQLFDREFERLIP